QARRLEPAAAGPSLADIAERDHGARIPELAPAPPVVRSPLARMAAAQQHDTLPVRLAQIGRTLETRFLGKDEVIRLLLVAAIAGEHAVLIGPPGTAKSALIRMFARLLQARYFEYLLTRFTEPNEIFGPVDIAAFREGRYERRITGMLP